ncbi:DUF317 domain-containing protein [Streptomyces sp. NPDC091040]|uniref:DUF317 domain-containing protein n=1 Tax=Streptomyces sp. NPDC091040 TaxID=3365972 RepID=UPI00382272CF
MTRKRQRQQGWGPEQPEQHYLVQPRTVAGGGDIRHISEYLRASGWRDRSTKRGPLIMESPDRTLRVAYDPHGQPGGWTIHGKATRSTQEWSAHLGRQTPVEIVAGLTDALPLPRSAHAPNVWAPLAEGNWNARFEGTSYAATSPDGAAWVQYRQEADGTAMWWTGANDTQGNSWTGAFTPTTPLHVVQAFTAQLASPEPVMRPRGRVPHSSKIRTWSVSVTPSQLGAWQQARINAARAATWARNSARSARPSTSAPPYAHAGGARTRR